MSRRRTCSSMNRVLCDSFAVSGESFLGSWIVPKRAMVHDQARASLTREKCPHPLDEYGNSQIGCREKLNVDSGPGQPREESAQVTFAALQNGEALADDRHVSFVEVAERTRRRFSRAPPINQLPHVASLLQTPQGARFLAFFHLLSSAHPSEIV